MSTFGVGVPGLVPGPPTPPRAGDDSRTMTVGGIRTGLGRRSSPVFVNPRRARPDRTAAAALPLVEDDELLRRARHAPEAFATFYERTFDELLGYFRRRVFDAELAADLTAETYAQLLRNLRRFDPARGSARQYLYGIARNQHLMWQRKGVVSNRYRNTVGIGQLPAWGEDEEAAVDRVDAARLVDAVRRAMASLPPGEREAVERRVLDGLPYRDVAQALGCSEVAARVRVSRGLAKLAGALDDPDRTENDGTDD